MKYAYNLILALALIIFVTACSSTRKTSQIPGASMWKANESVTARTNILLSDEKGKEITLGGTIRLKRDDVIQMNATYILGIQIGTIEFTKDSVLVVSRATRQYICLGYDALSHILARKVEFKDFQDIFWGEARKFEIKGLDWKYNTFVKLDDGRQLPEELHLAFSSAGKSARITMKMSGYNYSDDWTTRTKINKSNYTEIISADLIKLISLIL